jgi:diaminohydroxyphosphoribosylaminopyrimidine deaminase/5-amino-6-(5-phosphoribosylamino)uracil reductase
MAFTGVIQAIGEAIFVPSTHTLLVLVNDKKDFWKPCLIGSTVAINGVGLTLTAVTYDTLASFFVTDDIFNKSNFDRIVTAQSDADVLHFLLARSKTNLVNVERAVIACVGSENGIVPHNSTNKVTGLIDGTIKVSHVLRVDVAQTIIALCLENRSDFPTIGANQFITLDGIRFKIDAINGPYLFVGIDLSVCDYTTLKRIKSGDRMNIEFDHELVLSHLVSCGDASSSSNFNISEKDKLYMQLAIDLGKQGKCTAAPNPHVGCVIVDTHGNVIGEGYHQKAGQAHAEVRAIESVRVTYGEEKMVEMLKGATVYVTLEPCTFTPTKRTGPCDAQLIKYGVKRVVVGVVDSDERITNRGIKTLRDAGIQVDTGVLQDECVESMRAYFKHRKTGRPWVVLKIGVSLNGRMADIHGKPIKITGPASHEDFHRRWRATSQAILVSSTTAKKDNPLLNVRHYDANVNLELAQQPLRVVVGKHVELGSHLLDTKLAPTLVFTTMDFVEPDTWAKNGVQVVKMAELDEHGYIPFDQVLTRLGERGVLQVLVEGGPELTSNLLAASPHLVDQFVIYQSSQTLPEYTTLGWGGQHNIDILASFKRTNMIELGNDTCFEYVHI